MEQVAIDEVDIEINPLRVHEVRRPVSDALGTTDVAMNYFELQPGESFSGGLHTHVDQEEIFYVESGTATFEVGLERESVTVEAGELVRFPPGEYQTGGVAPDADEPVVGWAIGAPGRHHEPDGIRSVIPCRECGDEEIHETEMTADGTFNFECTECGTSFSV